MQQHQFQKPVALNQNNDDLVMMAKTLMASLKTDEIIKKVVEKIYSDGNASGVSLHLKSLAGLELFEG